MFKLKSAPAPFPIALVLVNIYSSPDVTAEQYRGSIAAPTIVRRGSVVKHSTVTSQAD